MKKIYINILLLVAVMVGLGSCTAGYDSVNRNRGGVTDEEKQRDYYALQASLVAMQDYVIPIDANMFQFIDCLMGGSWGGYLADASPGFTSSFAHYSAPDNWARVPFTDVIPKIFPNYFRIKQLTSDPVPLAVANIVKVMAMSRVVDTYGPMPYSKVGADGALNAPYDSQQQIYTEMFAELDSAITSINIYSTENFNAKADMVYGGNAVAWGKLANSLKLRLAIRLAYVDPTTAQEKAEEAVADPIGVMTANSDNAFLNVGTSSNPMRVVMYDYNGGDSRVSADITSYMNGYKDPRLSKYFTPSAFAGSPFVGLRSGIDIPPETMDGTMQYSSAVVNTDSPLMWMNAAEVAFLRAEGALRGWNMGGGTAQGYYEEGINLSFEQWGAAGAGTYIGDATSRPQAYVDPMGANSFTGTTSTITIKWDDTAPFETNLERIITQKWIANFPLGVEAWSEFRRTGYPKLMPAKVNNSGGVVNSDKMARRLQYPQEEYTSNNANVIAGVQLLGGPDNMATNVWWDKK